MYETKLREEVSQGDIFDNLPVVHVGQGPHPEIVYSQAMLLSHDCEYDKPASRTTLIARVLPLATLDANMQRLIRERRVLSAFYLEACGDILPEAYVDLRDITNLEKDIVRQSDLAGKRLVSLADIAREALQAQLGLFFGIDRNRN